MAGLRFANEPINPSFTNMNLHASCTGHAGGFRAHRGFSLIRIIPTKRNHPVFEKSVGFDAAERGFDSTRVSIEGLLISRF